MTYKVLTDHSDIIIYRSCSRHASTGKNLWLAYKKQNDPKRDSIYSTLGDDPSTGSLDKEDDKNPNDCSPPEVLKLQSRSLHVIDPNDLLGRTYLTQPMEDETRARLWIVEALDELDRTTQSSKEVLRFQCQNSEGTIEEIVAYNDHVGRIEWKDSQDEV